MLAAIAILLVSSSAWAQTPFIPNEGQWPHDYLYRAKFGHTTVFLGNDYIGFTQVLLDDDPYGVHHHIAGGHHYRINLLNSTKPIVTALGESDHYLNYFKGQRSLWRSNIHAVEEVFFEEIYAGVDMRLYDKYGQFKYDLLAADVDDLRDVQLYYEGVEDIQIIEERLHVRTSVGEVVEMRPYAYHPETKGPIATEFVLNGDTLSFDIDPTYSGPIVLDPTFIFSTYTGSVEDNWGYSATFDPSDSSAYAAGIVLDSDPYPFTPGAFDTTFNGGYSDVVISKFSADGKTMLYSTYLGGASAEQPSSIIADSTGRLIVLGTTGSSDFPTTITAHDTTLNTGAGQTINGFAYPNSSDLFVTVFNPSGSSLYGSTFVGGSGMDGLNVELATNYGDWVRGEVILSPQNTILIATSTNSSDVPEVNSYDTIGAGGQDAWLLELPLECDTLLWSSTYGGTADDAGFSIRVSPDGQSIYLAGSTESPSLDATASGVNSIYFGMRDGFVAQFSESTRAPVAAAYNGTTDYDMTFMMDLDRDGDVYLFGQTLGNYPTTPGAISDLFASVFVHEFSADLSSDLRSLAFGNKIGGSLAISPTAFAVDDCGDVYLSGWGGAVNLVPSSTRNMLTTADAYLDSTDGSDLYFAVIDAGFQRYNYATFFGGYGTNSDREHVDGGTSRFDSRGVMYQATCAGCGGSDRFPTFPNDVYSRVNGSTNCNMAITVIAFEQQDASVSVSVPDTACSPFQFTAIDTIAGADIVIWDFGGGDIDTSFVPPTRTFSTPGTYTLTVIALDTNCGTSDTASISFEVVNPSASANFSTSYDPCDTDYEVDFITPGGDAIYYWDFGDGNGDTTTGGVTHSYLIAGTYTVRLIAVASNCFGSAADTSFAEVTFFIPAPSPTIDFFYDGCTNQGEVRLSAVDTTGWDLFQWQLSDGQTLNGPFVITQVSTGFITVTLTVTDTNCNRAVSVTETYEVKADAIGFGANVPNVFTPDADGVNDFFQLQEGFVPNSLTAFSVKVYDRWGQLLFVSNQIDFKWDGRVDDRPLTEGVYFWIIESDSRCGSGIKENGIVHIMIGEQ